MLGTQTFLPFYKILKNSGPCLCSFSIEITLKLGNLAENMYIMLAQMHLHNSRFNAFTPFGGSYPLRH